MHGGDLRDTGCPEEQVAQLEQDYRTAALAPALRALLDYVVKLTRHPGRCGQADVAVLRGHGWSDEQIHNAAMTCAYFNFINRIASGLGVDDEPELSGKPPLSPWTDEPE